LTRLVLHVVVLLAVLGNGCGEDAAREGAADEMAPQMITELASGSSFALAAGAETRLRLSGKYEWSEPTVRGEAVELTRVDYFRDPGYSEWTVLAVRPGTATIEARGTPACAGQGCPDTPLRFQVELTVEA
jgi:hypothetical protein